MGGKASKPSDWFYPGNPERRARVRALNHECGDLVSHINTSADQLNHTQGLLLGNIGRLGRLLGFSVSGVEKLEKSWHMIEYKVPDKQSIMAAIKEMEAKPDFGKDFGKGFEFGITLGISGAIDGAKERSQLQKWEKELNDCKSKLSKIWQELSSDAKRIIGYGESANKTFLHVVALYGTIGIKPEHASTHFPPFVGHNEARLIDLRNSEEKFLSDPTIAHVSEAISNLRNVLNSGDDILSNPEYLEVLKRTEHLPKVTILSLWKLLKELNTTELSHMDKLSPELLKRLDTIILDIASGKMPDPVHTSPAPGM